VGPILLQLTLLPISTLCIKPETHTHTYPHTNTHLFKDDTDNDDLLVPHEIRRPLPHFELASLHRQSIKQNPVKYIHNHCCCCSCCQQSDLLHIMVTKKIQHYVIITKHTFFCFYIQNIVFDRHMTK